MIARHCLTPSQLGFNVSPISTRSTLHLTGAHAGTNVRPQDRSQNHGPFGTWADSS